jgi:hypothetical protein
VSGIEDTLWLDPTSDELLQQLFARLTGKPVMFVTTHRPERSPAWLGLEGVVSMNLERQHGMNIVLAITRGLALPTEVMEETLARTDGVPLYVEELTKSLIESGFLRKQGETYNVRSSPENLSIPASLRDSLMARLDRLEEHKEIAQIGACFGREFSYRLLERVAPIQGPELEHALDRLVSAGLAMQHGSPPSATYVFKHALVQDGAYDSLLRSRRKELHAAIALAGELTSHSAGVESIAHTTHRRATSTPRSRSGVEPACSRSTALRSARRRLTSSAASGSWVSSRPRPSAIASRSRSASRSTPRGRAFAAGPHRRWRTRARDPAPHRVARRRARGRRHRQHRREPHARHVVDVDHHHHAGPHRRLARVGEPHARGR